MPTITIPKKITYDGEYAIVPRKTYEEFLEWQRKIKSVRTYKPTKAELRELKRARDDFKKGKYVEWGVLKHELANLRKK